MGHKSHTTADINPLNTELVSHAENMEQSQGCGPDNQDVFCLGSADRPHEPFPCAYPCLHSTRCLSFEVGVDPAERFPVPEGHPLSRAVRGWVHEDYLRHLAAQSDAISQRPDVPAPKQALFASWRDVFTRLAEGTQGRELRSRMFDTVEGAVEAAYRAWLASAGVGGGGSGGGQAAVSGSGSGGGRG